MDSYEKLANAIVLQAVKDYRTALKRVARHPKDRDGLATKSECERFFRSGWGWYSSRGCCAPPKSKPPNGFPAPKGSSDESPLRMSSPMEFGSSLQSTLRSANGISLSAA